MEVNEVLPTLVAQRADEEPDKLFITEAISGRSVSRREFADLAHQWAAGLSNAGVAQRDAVLVMLPTSIPAVATWLGIARLCAMEVPVNPQYRGSMLSYLINDSTAQVMIVHADYLDQLLEVLDECPSLELVVVIGGNPPTSTAEVQFISESAFLADGVDIAAVEPPLGHDIAAIVYTSGTTGASKGVMMPWAQVYATALALGPTEQLTADDITYLPYPFYHVTIKGPVYQAALLGGSLVIREKISVRNYWDDIRKYGVTYTVLLGVMVSMLMNEEPRADDADNPLRLVGVVPRPANIADFETRFAVESGTIFNMTETSVPFTSHMTGVAEPTSCGRVRSGIQVRLVDQHDYPVAVGEVGELIVRADEPWTLNAGYWRKPAETAIAWRNGWFHTGDAFRCDADGNYFFVDRFKDAIRRRGENISSMEVESLVSAHPAIAEVAALGVPSPLGEEDIKIVVVVADGHELTAEALIDDLETRMPAFMVPRFVQFASSLPKTPTYKIRKVELRGAGADVAVWDRENAHRRRLA